MGGYTTKLLRQYDVQQGLCIICGEFVNIQYKNAKHSPTLEHIIPKSKGGTIAQTNICMSHSSCNNKRGDEVLSYKIKVFNMLPRKKRKLILNQECIKPNNKQESI